MRIVLKELVLIMESIINTREYYYGYELISQILDS